MKIIIIEVTYPPEGSRRAIREKVLPSLWTSRQRARAQCKRLADLASRKAILRGVYCRKAFKIMSVYEHNPGLPINSVKVWVAR